MFFRIIKLGLKNLRRRKSRTILTVLAISVGAVLILIVSSLGFGMENLLMAELEKAGKMTQIIVRPAVEGVSGGGPPGSNKGATEVKEGQSRSHEIPAEVVDKIIGISHVVDVSPSISVDTKSIRLSGTDKSYAARIEAVTISEGTEQEVLAGRNFETSDKGAIIIGRTYLKTFGFKEFEAGDIIGKDLIINIAKDWVEGEEVDAEIKKRYGEGHMQNLSRSQSEELWREVEEEMRENQSKEFNTEIIGVSASAFDSGNIYIPISYAADIFEYSRNDRDWVKNNGYNSIIVAVDKVDNVEVVEEDLGELEVSTQSFKDMFEGVLSIFSIVSIVLGTFSLIALFVAAIGVVNTMVMSTYERIREIGVMRATGASKKDIHRIFATEAGLLGFLGGVIGIIIGYCGQLLISFIVNNYFLTGIDVSDNPILAGGAKNLFITPLWLPLAIIGVTTFLGLIAGLFPARHAANLDPVDALKYE